MFKTDSRKNNPLFVLHHNHFIILFLTLFSLLFVYWCSKLSAEIYIAYQRKFVVPQMEKKFGFRGKREKFTFEENEYEIFSIDSVEPGSLFDMAGFKAGDKRFFMNADFIG